MTSFLEDLQPEPVEIPPPIVPDHTASDDTPRPFTRRSTKDRVSRVTSKPKKPVPPYQPGKVRKAVINGYGGLAFFIMPLKPNVALAMMGPAKAPTEEDPQPISVIENCADAWEAAAEQFPWVRQMFETSTNLAIITALVAAHVPMILALMEGTPLAEKLNPAAAMEAMLRRRAEAEAE